MKRFTECLILSAMAAAWVIFKQGDGLNDIQFYLIFWVPAAAILYIGSVIALPTQKTEEPKQ